MKDKLEQLYISACIGQWDSSTFADRAMELLEPKYEISEMSDEKLQSEIKNSLHYVSTKECEFTLNSKCKAVPESESKIVFWKDGMFFKDIACTIPMGKVDDLNDGVEVSYKIVPKTDKSTLK
mgnify:CR=1 FL=1